ncbi:MAG: S-layer homology domain-containing protein [Ruminiclostridium sp.]|nr:S-layer homology domain-containing protein [Ruminiclostridium sp.]
MMKVCQRIFLVLLVAVLLTPAAFASYRHWNHGNHSHQCSDWAKAEILQAEELGLLSSSLPEDYRSPITRIDFCRMALCYAAIQSDLDYATFCAQAQAKLPCGADGKVRYAFTDCGNGEDALTATIAKELGIVNGKGTGTFDPQGSITRQEAAVMLTRASKATGNSLSEAGAGAALSGYFTDSNTVASWAKDSIAAVANIKVMNGVGNGAFGPHGSYSIEQSAATFLRLCRHHETHHGETNNTVPGYHCPYGTPNCTGNCNGCIGYDCPYGVPNCTGNCNGCAGYDCPYGTPNCTGNCNGCNGYYQNGSTGGSHHWSTGGNNYGHHGSHCRR